MKNNHDTTLILTVGHAEVEEMLDSYDSGMSDRTTRNAVALALQKVLKPNLRVKVFNNAAIGFCECRIEDSEIELPRAMANWLERAEHAFPVNPISFPVSLKDKWLENPLAANKSTKQETPHYSIAA